jgi:hypothetical protein
MCCRYSEDDIAAAVRLHRSAVGCLRCGHRPQQADLRRPIRAADAARRVGDRRIRRRDDRQGGARIQPVGPCLADTSSDRAGADQVDRSHRDRRRGGGVVGVARHQRRAAVVSGPGWSCSEWFRCCCRAAARARVGRASLRSSCTRRQKPTNSTAVWRPPRSPAILKGNCRRRSFSARIRTPQEEKLDHGCAQAQNVAREYP